MWRLLRRYLTGTLVGASAVVVTLALGSLAEAAAVTTLWYVGFLVWLPVALWAIVLWRRRRKARQRAEREWPARFDLVLADQTRVPLVGVVTLGRAPSSTVVLADPSVSRMHARISPGDGDGPRLEDLGSRYGTFVDGVRVRGPVRLREGARLTLGDSELVVEPRRDADVSPGRTIIVPRDDPAPRERQRVHYRGWGPPRVMPDRREPGQRQVPYRLQVAATVAGMLTGVAGVVIGVISLRGP
jgi:hypothetical protein